MNHNLPLPATETNPFGQPQADPAEAGQWAAEIIKENKTSTRVRRAIGDKMLRLVGKGNKVARVNGYEDPAGVQAATRESVDAVLANPRRATKKEHANAAALQSGFDVMDSQQASKDFQLGRIDDEIAALDRQLGTLYDDPYSDSNVAAGMPVGKVTSELQKRRQDAVARREAAAGIRIDTTWAEGMNGDVAGEQRRNLGYNAAERTAPAVRPEDMPGYNPFAAPSSEAPEQPKPENPFAA